MLSSGKYLYQNLSAVTWICDLTVHADVGTCWRNPQYQRQPPPPPIIDSSTPQPPQPYLYEKTKVDGWNHRVEPFKTGISNDAIDMTMNQI